MASGGDGDESWREEREDSWVAGLYDNPSDDEEQGIIV